MPSLPFVPFSRGIPPLGEVGPALDDQQRLSTFRKSVYGVSLVRKGANLRLCWFVI